MMFTLQILCILAMVCAGFFARRKGLLTAAGTHDLARVSLSIVYPALILSSVTQLRLADLRLNAMLPLLTMGIALTGLGLGLLLVRFLGRVSQATARAFLFHCLINNYLFLPLPLVLFRYGPKGVALLIFASVGYELLLWSVGVMLFSTQEETRRISLRSLFSPPFMALLAGIAIVILRDLLAHAPPPLWFAQAVGVLREALSDMGAATIALSMLVAGSRFAVLRFEAIIGWRVWLVGAIRLLGVPLLVIPLLGRIPMEETARGILTIVAVMPSAMVSVLFSERYGGDTDFIAGALLLTHLWALVSVPLLLSWAL
ncbi:MAG: AEC family transporter [Verrucomicrobiota bacterium]|jgi:predicted permease|nr:AEC family transporter [Verrucomicrobiota bacterium]